MIVRGNIADLLDPSMRKIYDDVYKKFSEEYSKIFNVLGSTKKKETDSGFSGFGMAQDMNEAEEIPYDDPLQLYDVTYTHGKIGLGFKVSKESVEDDQFNVIRKKPAALATAVHRKVEKDAALILNNAFTSGTGGDGQYLIDDDHPRGDGGTAQSNDGGANTLTETNLNTGILAMNKFLDDKGQKISVIPNKLIVPPDLEAMALILMKSALRTNTANNDINPLKGKLDILVYHWLTSTTAWFLLDKAQSQLNFFWRRKPGINRDDKISAEIARWYVSARYSVGWSDWRGIYGGAGA